MAFCWLPFSLSGAAAQTPQERAQIEWAEQRGRLIYDMDGAAWVGTDDALARVPDARNQNIRGYIVERDGSGFTVTFYAGAVEAPVAVYRGYVENRAVLRREVYPAESRPALTAMQRRLAAARGLVRSLGRRPCGEQPFNTVIVPAETADGSIDLYLLTPQANRNEWPAGGHFRATISAAGTVESSRAFTNTCIALGGGQNSAGLIVTHLLDPIPTEIHVFTALSAGIPLYVATNSPDRVWEIDGGRIRLVEDRPQRSGS